MPGRVRYSTQYQTTMKLTRANRHIARLVACHARPLDQQRLSPLPFTILKLTRATYSPYSTHGVTPTGAISDPASPTAFTDSFHYDKAAYSAYSTHGVAPTGPSNPHPTPITNRSYQTHEGSPAYSSYSTRGVTSGPSDPHIINRSCQTYSFPAVQNMTYTAVQDVREDVRDNHPTTTTHPSACAPYVIKRKRKRADPDQLKALNSYYNRTAYPTTAERAKLARQLGMTTRGVQIWSALALAFIIR